MAINVATYSRWLPRLPLFHRAGVSMYRPKDETDIPRLFKDTQKEEEFVELAIFLAEDDRPATEIQSEEEDYFRDSDSEREALARELIVVAGLSERFVEDTRL